MTRDVLMHVHGVGDVDFSAMSPADLDVVEGGASADGYDVVPTVFLARARLEPFRRVVERYERGGDVRYPSIRGFAIEGPLLSGGGGVPRDGCWRPTAREWRRIASLGDSGLRYVVLAPDAVGLDEEIADGMTFRDLIDDLYGHGVLLALGHFDHRDPWGSACRTRDVIDYVQRNYGPSPHVLITDHLFNDMPRNFVHAWRSPEEQKHRRRELESFLSRSLSEDDLANTLGPVPATLVHAALHAELTLALNFDGEHVDLAICRRIVSVLGTDRFFAITDHTDAATMGGEQLHRRAGTALRYRDDGIVAAGSCGVDGQRRNMKTIGLSADDVHDLLRAVPERILASCDALGSRGHEPGRQQARRGPRRASALG